MKSHQRGRRAFSWFALLPASSLPFCLAILAALCLTTSVQAIGILEGGVGVGLGGTTDFGSGDESVRPAGMSMPSVLGGRFTGRVDFGSGLVEVSPTIVAGDPSGLPPDSPTNRIDPNTLSSAFGGVGSLRLVTGSGTFICSGTAISPWNVLTAAHCLDLDNNGVIDVTPANVEFRLNHGSNTSSIITAAALAIHPNFTGFANPSVNDDLAVITLAAPLPAATPIYALHAPTVSAGTTFTLAGYGISGDGISGYSGGASFTRKRVGQNNADSFTGNDESGPPATEVFRYDFDGPIGNDIYGGPTLGNVIETMIGGGDSGGPGFVDNNGNLEIAGVSTFIFAGDNGTFGDRAGGVLVAPYVGWINAQIIPEPSSVLLASLGLWGLLFSPARRRSIS